MKTVLFFTLMFFAFSVSNAQEWQTDFKKAKELAAKEHKTIILVFQGSDWCAPCIKLEKDVWSTPYFKTYALDHYVMLKADFPRRKSNQLSEEQTAANKKLAELYNRNGYFPFVVILDKDGKVLGQLGYKKLSPEEYIEELNGHIL